LKLSSFNEQLTLLANLGVIAGIVFLGIEINQNSKMMATQTRTDIALSVMHVIEAQRNPGVVEANRKLAAGEELEFEDTYYLGNLARTTLRTWENTYYQYQNGLFSDSEFQADFSVWELSMPNPHMSQSWEREKLTYSPEFRKIMDQISE